MPVFLQHLFWWSLFLLPLQPTIILTLSPLPQLIHTRLLLSLCRYSISTCGLYIVALLPPLSTTDMQATHSNMGVVARRTRHDQQSLPMDIWSSSLLTTLSSNNVTRLMLHRVTESELTSALWALPSLVHINVGHVVSEDHVDFWNRWPATLPSTLPNIRSIHFQNAPSLEWLCTNTFQQVFPHLEVLFLGHHEEAMCVSLSYLCGLRVLHTLHIDGPVNDLVFHVEEGGRRKRVFDYHTVFPALRSLNITFDEVDGEMVQVCSNLPLRECALVSSAHKENAGLDPRSLLVKAGPGGRNEPTAFWHSIEDWTISCSNLTSLDDLIVSAPRLRSLTLRGVDSMSSSELNKISLTCAPRLENFQMECLIDFAVVKDAVHAILRMADQLKRVHLTIYCCDQDGSDSINRRNEVAQLVKEVFERLSPRAALEDVIVEDEHEMDLLSAELKQQLMSRHSLSALGA